MLFHAHSGIRYLVLLFGAAALLYALFGLVAGRRYDRGMRILASSFAGVLHLQIVLGVAVVFTRGFQPPLIGHITMMLFAAAAAQIPTSVMKRRNPEERTYGPHLVGAAVALLLVAGGILAIGRSVV